MTKLLESPATMTVVEAGNLLGISRNLAYKAARDGSIPTIRIGDRILVPREQFKQLLAGERTVHGEAA